MSSILPGLPAPAPDPESVHATVAAIDGRDPAFNLDGFLAEAQQAFWLVGRAHAECKPELCRTVLSPELAAREQAAIVDSCRDRTAVAPGDEDSKTGALVSITTDGHVDTAVVHFVSVWRPVTGKARDQRRIQNWCFQRPATARTAQTSEGQHCTNCGAPLSASAGTCRFCGAAIGTGAGWQVIRIDDVAGQEAAQAAAAMRSIISEVMAARQASRSGAGQTAPERGRTARKGSGCLPVLVVVIIAIAGFGVAAAGGSGTVHRDVAKLVPFLRHPRLAGPLTLGGQISSGGVTATQVPPRFQYQGTCAKEAIRTAWYFTAKLPDGSRFTLQVGLPPGQGGPGAYQQPVVSLSADAQNASRFSSWTLQTAGRASLSVRADGGGDLTFANLTPGQGGGSPLSGHLAWSCTLA